MLPASALWRDKVELPLLRLLLPPPPPASPPARPFPSGQTVYDTTATLTGLPATGTVSVRIAAANAGGEGVPGNVVDLVMG